MQEMQTIFCKLSRERKYTMLSVAISYILCFLFSMRVKVECTITYLGITWNYGKSASPRTGMGQGAEYIIKTDDHYIYCKHIITE